MFEDINKKGAIGSFFYQLDIDWIAKLKWIPQSTLKPMWVTWNGSHVGMVWMSHRLYSAFKFAIPLLVLLLIWEFSIQFFQVNARVFPSIESVYRAGLEAVHDGSIFNHVAASLGRVAVGTLLAVLVSIPLGVAMGLNPIVSDFLSPLFRFFSVLAGIAWIPIATLWFGYGFGAITFVIFNN